MTHLNTRADALADRLVIGANSLAKFAEGLSDLEWNTSVLGEGRTFGVVVHHVASVYPIEVVLAKILSKRNPITDVTKDAIDKMNAQHAIESRQAEDN